MSLLLESVVKMVFESRMTLMSATTYCGRSLFGVEDMYYLFGWNEIEDSF
jgi:hypothetical protein